MTSPVQKLAGLKSDFHPLKMDRSVAVSGFQDVIAELDPKDAAEAMYQLSLVYIQENPARGYVPDYDENLKWLQSSFEVAPAGSDEQYRALNFLTMRLRVDRRHKEAGKFVDAIFARQFSGSRTVS